MFLLRTICRRFSIHKYAEQTFVALTTYQIEMGFQIKKKKKNYDNVPYTL